MDVYDRYERDAERYLAVHGLHVEPGLLPAVREILVRETRNEADTYAGVGSVPGNTELMRICAVQLWHGGQVEDALLIHRARRTSMDATGAIDAELLLGAGPARTKEYLAGLGTDEALEMLDVIAGVEEWYDAESYSARIG
ncbi:hypothetical protein ACFY36_31600 [Actinoplanes sp. NPDC000266]